MKTIELAFWDFDGTLFDSPLPETGKLQWEYIYKQPYPYQGWWGRAESLDSELNIKPNSEVLEMFNLLQQPHIQHRILTSRLSKFRPRIQELCDEFNIKVEEIMCKTDLNKGKRIVEKVKHLQNQNFTITKVYFFDDRDVEIETVNAVMQELFELGVELSITQIK